MTRQIRYIIITVCIIAVLGVVLLLIKFLPNGKTPTSSSSSSSSDSSAKLTTIDTGNVVTVHVVNSNGSYTIRNIGSASSSSGSALTWTVDELSAYPLSQSSIINIVDEVTTLTASQIVAQNGSSNDQYGLATPKATVDVTTKDGKTITLIVGNTTPFKNGYYAMKKGDNNIYIISTVDGDDFSSSSKKLIDLSLSTLDSSKLNLLTNMQFVGTSHQTPIKLAIDPSSVSSYSATTDSNGQVQAPTYLVVSPGSYQTNTTPMNTLVNNMISLNATDVVSLDTSDKTLSSYGLLKPANTFTYTYDKKDYTVSFGNTFTKDTTEYIYLMVNGKNIVYDIPTSSVSYYNYQLMDFVSGALIYTTPQIDTLKTVTVTDGTNTWKYDLSGTVDTLKVTSGSKTINTAQFRNYYQQLCYIEPSGTATRTNDSKLLCRITFESRVASVSNEVVEFMTLPDATNLSAIDAYRAACVVNGNSDFYVKKSQVVSIIQYSQDIVDGKTIPAPF